MPVTRTSVSTTTLIRAITLERTKQRVITDNRAEATVSEMPSLRINPQRHVVFSRLLTGAVLKVIEATANTLEVRSSRPVTKVYAGTLVLYVPLEPL